MWVMNEWMISQRLLIIIIIIIINTVFIRRQYVVYVGKSRKAGADEIYSTVFIHCCGLSSLHWREGWCRTTGHWGFTAANFRPSWLFSSFVQAMLDGGSVIDHIFICSKELQSGSGSNITGQRKSGSVVALSQQAIATHPSMKAAFHHLRKRRL